MKQDEYELDQLLESSAQTMAQVQELIERLAKQQNMVIEAVRGKKKDDRGRAG